MVAVAARYTESLSEPALRAIAALWFAVALVGQWLFVYYLAIAYVSPTLAGDPAAWNRTQPIMGHVAGDATGNALFISHVSLAIIISLGGMLQLVPQVRAHLPALHRWNGRLFMLTAVLMASGGLLMTWWRGAQLSLVGAIGVSVNGVLILAFSAIALHHVWRRQIALHRRWALRTFMVVNGVWFYRLGFMAWILINQGPLGSTPALDGPFDMTWAFASYLLPLAVLELYFLGQRPVNPETRWAIVAALVVFTALTALGIFGAYQIMWKPHI